MERYHSEIPMDNKDLRLEDEVKKPVSEEGMDKSEFTGAVELSEAHIKDNASETAKRIAEAARRGSLKEVVPVILQMYETESHTMGVDKKDAMRVLADSLKEQHDAIVALTEGAEEGDTGAFQAMKDAAEIDAVRRMLGGSGDSENLSGVNLSEKNTQAISELVSDINAGHVDTLEEATNLATDYADKFIKGEEEKKVFLDAAADSAGDAFKSKAAEFVKGTKIENPIAGDDEIDFDEAFGNIGGDLPPTANKEINLTAEPTDEDIEESLRPKIEAEDLDKALESIKGEDVFMTEPDQMEVDRAARLAEEKKKNDSNDPNKK